VRAIAGYMVDNRGRTVVLVSVINHSQAVAAQAFQEAVVQWVWSRGAEP